MSRFYVPREHIVGDKIYIDGPEAHHILDVMRLEEGDDVTVFDGAGREYDGVISEQKKASMVVLVRSVREVSARDEVKVILFQAIPKGDKIDFIAEKATELGAHTIVPVITARTIIRWDKSKRLHHTDRLKKIVESAAKQCGRLSIPSVYEVDDFARSLEHIKRADLKLIAALHKDTISLRKALEGFKGKSIAVMIGPEGDFTQDEIALAVENRSKLVSLGSRVLRSETAGLAALSIIGYELEE